MPDIRIVEDQVARNATFATMLATHDLGGEAYAFVEAVRPVFDPRDLQVDHPYKLVYDRDDVFRRFEYHVDEDQFLQVVSRPDSGFRFEAALVDYEKEREEVAMRGTIDRENNSLTAAVDAGAGASASRCRWPRCSRERSTSTPSCSPATTSSCSTSGSCATRST